MYETWYGLARRPFRAAPHSERYFAAGDIEVAKDQLIGCIQNGAGPALVVGLTGTGKTTLALQVAKHFKPTMPVVLLAGSTCMTRRNLLQNSLSAVGLPFDGNDDNQLRLSLHEYFKSRGPGGSLLIIDEAGKLDTETLDELRAMASLSNDGDWCVHVALLGTMRLEEHLSLPMMEPLNQRIGTRCYLGPWTREETTNYIEAQLAECGFDAANWRANDGVFDESAVRMIQEKTGGIPRLINQICDHSMTVAAGVQADQISEDDIARAWADLQKLPPPVEKQPAPAVPGEEIVEFGMLDDFDNDISASVAADDSGVQSAESVEEPQATEDSDTAPFEKLDDLIEVGELDDADREVSSPVAASSSTAQVAVAAATAAGLVSAAAAVPVVAKLVDSGSVSPDVVAENRAAAGLPANENLVNELSQFSEENCDSDDASHGDECEVAVETIKNAVDEIGLEAQEFTEEQTPPDATADTDTNPFLEQFEEEEIVLGRPVGLQQTRDIVAEEVQSASGQQLVEELRLHDMHAVEDELLGPDGDEDLSNEFKFVDSAELDELEREAEIASGVSSDQSLPENSDSATISDGASDSSQDEYELAADESEFDESNNESLEATAAPSGIKKALAACSLFVQPKAEETDDCETTAQEDAEAEFCETVECETGETGGTGESGDCETAGCESETCEAFEAEACEVAESNPKEEPSATLETAAVITGIAAGAAGAIAMTQPEDNEPFEYDADDPATMAVSDCRSEDLSEDRTSPEVGASRQQVYGAAESDYGSGSDNPVRAKDETAPGSRKQFSRLFTSLRKKKNQSDQCRR